MQDPDVEKELKEIENLALNIVLHEGKVRERQRILLEIDRLEEQSHATKTPIYQDTLFKRIREIVLQLS